MVTDLRYVAYGGNVASNRKCVLSTVFYIFFGVHSFPLQMYFDPLVAGKCPPFWAVRCSEVSVVLVCPLFGGFRRL